MENEFDYSLVDNETADFLRSCEYEMNGIAEDARVKFGGVLKKAQDKLANHDKGVFYKWFQSGGMNKNEVYYAINVYELSINLDNQQRDNFLNAPKSLQKETMKKSAPEDMKQKVFDGDIKTHKEYKEELKRREEAEQKAKEFEQRAKQAEQQAEIECKERERLERENEELANVEPERIEVVPDDYDFYKGNYESAVNLQKRYKDQMEEKRKERNETDIKGGDEEDRLRKREKTLKNKIKSIEKINDVQFHLDDVISQISTKTHSLDVNELLNDYQVLDDFESTINEVINVCKELKNKLPNKNIIEGEIVNE